MSKKVLLVEDEPNIIEAISFILSREGYSVKTHSNGADALEIVRSVSPDIVVLDVMLPGRSGYDILQDIRKQDELSSLPVLLLTARGQARDREMAEQLGANRYMMKPFSNADMVNAIRDLAPV